MFAPVVNERIEILVAVEERAGCIYGYLCLESGADTLSGATVLLVGQRDEWQIRLGFIEKFEYVREARVDRVPVNSHFLYAGVHIKTLPYDRNRSVFADEVEVIVSLEELGFGLPLHFFGTGHIRHVIHVFHKDVTAPYASVHSSPVSSDYIGGRHLSTGDAEHIIRHTARSIGHGSTHKVPHFISTKHRRVRTWRSVICHIRVAGRQILNCT